MVFFAVWGVIGLAALLALYSGVYLLSKHEGRGASVRVAMPATHDADALALALYEAHVIDRPWLFAWMLRVTGAAETAPTVGSLSLRDDLTPRAVLRAVANGVGLVRVTVPEGQTIFEVAERLATAGVISDAEGFVQRARDPQLIARLRVRGDSLEGYLFPDTYDLAPGAGADVVIEAMVRGFHRRFSEALARHPGALERARRAGLDERGLVTLASMVEEEAGAPEDRGRVSSVFWNRLTRGDFPQRVLQSDPTVVYGCRVAPSASCTGVAGTGRVTITRAMLDDAGNRYNTYRHPGVPPGPVSNPGLASLEAAMEPAQGDYLYFVATGQGGRSAFGRTLAEHNANVQRYLHRGP